MTNPKIAKVVGDIAATKKKIIEYQLKLRELEQAKINLENDEVIALFRREKLSEDEFAELIRASRRREEESVNADFIKQ